MTARAPAAVRRALACIVAAAGFAACTPPRLVQPDGRPVVSDERVARAEADEARARIDSALRDGDTPRFLALLDSGIVVVLPGGDSLVGRAAIARQLSARYDDVRAAALHYFPHRVVMCMDGLVETGSDVTLFVGHAQRADTIATWVNAQWRNAGPRAWRLVRLELGREVAGQGPARRLCARVDAARYAQSRFKFSATLPMSYQNVPAKVGAENRLRAQGYVIGKTPPRPRAGFFNSPVDADDAGTIAQGEAIVSLRARVRGPWWLDLSAGYGGLDFSSFGYNAVSGSRVRIDLSTRQAAALLLQYEPSWWRIGAGVGTVASAWTLYEDRSDNAGGAAPPLEITNASVTGVGGVLEAAASFPIGSAAFVEARLRQRLGTTLAFPAFGSVRGGGNVNVNATALFVGIGVAY